MNETIKELLHTYDQINKNRTERKEVSLTELVEEVKQELREKTPARYIPAKVKKVLHLKHHGRCAFPGCMKLPEIYHHTRRFALNPDHDPDFLVPLCKGHERLAHQGLIGNEEKPPDEWYLKSEADHNLPKYNIDVKVNQFRKRAQGLI